MNLNPLIQKKVLSPRTLFQTQLKTIIRIKYLLFLIILKIELWQ